MKIPVSRPNVRVLAFTLIELIAVIVIIGILAGLIFPITAAVQKQKMRSVAQAELQQIATAIEDYKSKNGFYPPDNPTNAVRNPLYFELMGTTNDGVNYVTLDGSGRVQAGSLPVYFGISGFANSGKGRSSGDEGGGPRSFIKGLRPVQIGSLDSDGEVKLLLCSVSWPSSAGISPVLTNGDGTWNPWRYKATNPTNNTDSFDLWIDVVIRGKTNRISNWKKDPETIP